MRCKDLILGQQISIHALREEGDRARSCACRCDTISIHALREEGDTDCQRNKTRRHQFLSTPSARRATLDCKISDLLVQISIHALREEGDTRWAASLHGRQYFYPRPPRGGRPPPVEPKSLIHFYFYPRPPRGGRLFKLTEFAPLYDISIHALREEGDTKIVEPLDAPDKFLSTPSARRATRGNAIRVVSEYISIHALREEGDATL